MLFVNADLPTFPDFFFPCLLPPVSIEQVYSTVTKSLCSWKTLNTPKIKAGPRLRLLSCDSAYTH